MYTIVCMIYGFLSRNDWSQVKRKTKIQDFYRVFSVLYPHKPYHGLEAVLPTTYLFQFFGIGVTIASFVKIADN